MKIDLRKPIHIWSSRCFESYNTPLRRERHSKVDKQVHERISRCDLVEETVGCVITYPSPTYYELLILFTLILIHANTLRMEYGSM